MKGDRMETDTSHSPRRSILHSFLNFLESSSIWRSMASDRAFSTLSCEEMQFPMTKVERVVVYRERGGEPA